MFWIKLAFSIKKNSVYQMTLLIENTIERISFSETYDKRAKIALKGSPEYLCINVKHQTKFLQDINKIKWKHQGNYF